MRAAAAAAAAAATGGRSEPALGALLLYRSTLYKLY
jgi:hypothetical protein